MCSHEQVGALEYEPDVPEHMRVHHREFLRDKAVFKEIVPIEDVALRAKIHQTYRMGYVKDVILPRVLDDGTMTTLNTLMHFNNVDVSPSFLCHQLSLIMHSERMNTGGCSVLRCSCLRSNVLGLSL